MNKLSKLLNVVIYLCIISYALPTGVMKGIPIQKILVCLLIILGGICLVLQRKSLEIIKSAKLEITLGVLGLLACIVSYILGNEWSIKFTGLFYISVIVFVELYFLVRYELAESEKIVECILYMMLLKILGKIIIEIVFVCKLIEYEAVIEFYLNMFGTEASTMTMHLGRLLLIRVQTSSDIIVVTLMPFYWMMEKYKKSIRSLLFALSGIYTLIVFSRVLMVEFCCLAEDFLCKIIPADISAFICCMIVTIFVSLDHVNEKSCKVKCIGWCSDLVIYNFQCIVCLCYIEHCLDKVLTVLSEYPRDTYDEVFIQRLRYRKLSGKFCLSIYIQWFVILTVRFPGFLSLPVKYIVCTDVYHLTV